MRIVKDAGTIQFVADILNSFIYRDVLMRGMDAVLVLISQDCVIRPLLVPDHRIPSGWQGR